MGVNVSIELTEAEMKALDDGQGWYKPGDRVWLGGYLDGIDGEAAVPLDLCVNGTTHDNWITWHELPEGIRRRLLADG